MFSCKRATELTCQSLDRRLTFPERLGLRLHLLVCRACGAFHRQTRFLDRSMQKRFLSPEEAGLLGRPLPADACERIKRRLREAAHRGNGADAV